MSHKLGQVFLKDGNILRKILSESGVTRSDVVVEVGCGDGDLTVLLADAAKKLIVIELDPICIEATKVALGTRDNVEFVHQDVLKFDFESIGSKFKIVANIPYYISAKMMKSCITYRHLIETGTFMVQKEFCEKLVAKPKAKVYTSLTVFFSAFFDSKFLFNVSRTCFKPVPNVDSAVFQCRPHGLYEFDEEDTLFDIVRSSFWGRRKPLRSALKKSPYLSLLPGFDVHENVQDMMARRGEELSLKEFITLCKHLKAYVSD